MLHLFWLLANLAVSAWMVYAHQTEWAMVFGFLAGVCWERLYRD